MSDQVDQSVETDTTPGVEEVSSQETPVGAEQQAAAQETKEEKLTPFHEHPRFKEVIEQNRGYKSELEQTKSVINQLQQQLDMIKQQTAPKTEPVKDPFLADLEKINPAYAKSLQSIYDRAGKTEELERRLAAYESQQFAEKAYAHFDKLLATAKVPEEMKSVYTDAVEAEVYRRESKGQKLGLGDLDAIFNSFHSKYSKFLEERERQITAKYVTTKKSDSTPKGATGGAPSVPGAKKIAAGDISAQAKWLADQIRQAKKPI